MVLKLDERLRRTIQRQKQKVDELVQRMIERQERAINIVAQEDPEVVSAVERYIRSRECESDQALRHCRHKVWEDGDGEVVMKNVFRDIRLRLKTGQRRKHVVKTPSAVRQHSFRLGTEAIKKHKQTRVVQLVPHRRHPSSGYPFPEWLQDYGVSKEDWEAFTSRIRHVDCLSLTQYLIFTPTSIIVESMTLAPWPLKFISGLGGGIFVTFLYLKHRNLRRAVRNGHLPRWTAYWNETYFGPKGLSVGFDMPGPVFPTAFVHPRQGLLFPWSRDPRGPYKKPMSISRAARKARVTIALVSDPRPEQGRVPKVDALKVPFIQRLWH